MHRVQQFFQQCTKLRCCEWLLQYRYFFVPRLDEIVVAGHEGERHAPPQQMIRGCRVVSPAYIDIQENDVVVALSKLPACHGHGVSHTGHAIANLPRHFFDHEGNKQLILYDEYARRVFEPGRSGSGDMPRVWCRGRMLMIAQRSLTEADSST